MAIIGLSVTTIYAQSTDAFNYQAVVRGSDGNILANQNISFRISLLAGTIDGSSVYTETHSTQTSDNGVVSLKVGTGTVESGLFSSINWGSTEHFIQVEVDLDGGTNYELLGTTQLLSVPYALHAKTVDQNSLFWNKEANDLYYQEGSIGLGGQLVDSTHQLQIVQNYLGILFDRNNEGYGETQADVGISSNQMGLPGFRMRVSEDNGTTFTDGIFIEETGNVGINNVLPEFNLDVDGIVNADEYLINGNPITFNSPWLSNLNNIFYTEGLVGLGDSLINQDHQLQISQNYLGILFDRNNEGYGDTQADIGISSNQMGLPGFRMRVSEDNGANFVDGLFIEETGNVGINNVLPEYNLDVNGVINADEYLINGTPLATSPWTVNSSDISYSTGLVSLGDAVVDQDHQLQISQNYLGILFDRNNGGYSDTQADIGISANLTGLPGLRLRVSDDNGTNFTDGLFIEETGNIGVGTTLPKSKLEVADGDVYIDQIGAGVIMKSPDGQCWRLSVDNSGNASFQSTTCPN